MSMLSCRLGFTKVKMITSMNLMVICCFAMVRPTITGASLFSKKLELIYNFRCDQIYNFSLYNFGHTLLCCSSLTV